MKKKDVIKNIIERGSDITGSISSGVISAVSGPEGIIIGSILGAFMTNSLKNIGLEIHRRVFSPREYVRIGASYTFAIEKILEYQRSGINLREDNFFIPSINDRSFSEEILEGIITTAQKEYEERKIKHLGYLYANICTNPLIGLEEANILIKITNSITYRQLCILELLNQKETLNASNNKNQLISYDLTLEIKDLIQKGFVRIDESFVNLNSDEVISKSNHIFITKAGINYCELLLLNELNQDDVLKIIFLS